MPFEPTNISAVTKGSIGLGSVDNTADASKPVSTAQAAAILNASAKRIISSASPFTAPVRYDGTDTYSLCCVDSVDGRLIAVNTSGGVLKQSAWGTISWSGTKGFPSDVTWANFGAGVRFGGNLYFACKVTADSRVKVFSCAPASGNTAFSWSGPLLTHVSGATKAAKNISCDATYLYSWEYGDPTGGPSIYQSSDGTNWATIYGPDATIRHIHWVEPDPYNYGHVWMTCGDGIAKSIQKSTDYGATWSVIVASSTWQGVQISFSPNWVWIACDSQQGTVMVINRATGTPYIAATNWHANTAYSYPGGAAGDAYYRNAYIGCVDPATETYYCVANDASTTPAGNKEGVFVLPFVGGRVETLHPTLLGSATGSHVEVANGRLYLGNGYKTLLALTTV